MAFPKLSKELADLTYEALKNAGWQQGVAAAALKIGRSTMAGRIRLLRERGYEVHTIDAPAQTVDERVLQHRERRDQATMTARLRDAHAEIARLQDRLKDYEWASRAFTPADWTLDIRRPKGKSPHIPVLLFSDAQAGEVVRAGETETPWPYDTATFQQRYKRMIETTIYLCMEHRGENWTFPGVIYVRLGDSISGGLHEDLREGGEDSTPLEQVRTVFEAETWGIEELKKAFGKVEVKSPGSGGNHDRNTVKPRSKLAHERNYDRLVCYMLQKHFASDKLVTFQTSMSPDVRFPIFDLRALVTHGDRIGARGGQGFVGPAATIMRGGQRVLMEQAALGHVVDTIFLGHFHYPMVLPWIVCNGSFTGTTEYGKQGRMRPIAPMQHLLFYADRGFVDYRPIYLAE